MHDTKNTLIKILSFHRASRKAREDAAKWVLQHPKSITNLLQICFQEKKTLSHKAAWVLEIVCENNLTLLQPHKTCFLINIKGLQDDQANRPYSKICFWLVKAHYKTQDFLLTKAEKQLLTEICFDWLITNQKVACEVFAMQSLLLLGNEFEWIYPELKTILEQNIPHKSTAYKSRALKCIDAIKNG